MEYSEYPDVFGSLSCVDYDPEKCQFYTSLYRAVIEQCQLGITLLNSEINPIINNLMNVHNIILIKLATAQLQLIVGPQTKNSILRVISCYIDKVSQVRGESRSYKGESDQEICLILQSESPPVQLYYVPGFNAFYIEIISFKPIFDCTAKYKC